jgi:hypothetical protein
VLLPAPSVVAVVLVVHKLAPQHQELTTPEVAVVVAAGLVVLVFPAVMAVLV